MKIVFPLLVAFFGYLVSVYTFLETASWTIESFGLGGFVYKILFMLAPALVASWMIEIVLVRFKEYEKEQI